MKIYIREDENVSDKNCKNIGINFIFMGPCIVRYRGGTYDQQDATNSQYLLLEMLYMFRAPLSKTR
jgi:hypothetical protein